MILLLKVLGIFFCVKVHQTIEQVSFKFYSCLSFSFFIVYFLIYSFLYNFLHFFLDFDILTAKRVVMSDLSNNIGNLLQRSTVKKMNPKQAYPSFDQAILAYKFTDGLIFIRKLNMLHGIIF